MRRDYIRLSPSQLLYEVGQQELDYILDRPPFTRYWWNGTEFADFGTGAGTVTSMTEAQILAAATAGELTAGTFYRSSDSPYTLYYASTASTALPVDTAGYLGVMTMAEMQAHPAPVAGMTATTSDVGNRRVRWEYSGTAWLPYGGRQLAVRLSAPIGRSSAAGQTGTIELMPSGQWTFPAGTFSANGIGLEIFGGIDKIGGTAEAPQTRVLIGSAGTTADTAIFGTFTMTTTTVAQGFTLGATRESDVSMRVEGSGVIGTADRFNGGSTAARLAGIAVGDMDAAGVTNYISIATTASGAFAEYVNAHKFDVYIVG